MFCRKKSVLDKSLAPSLQFHEKDSGATFKLFRLQQSLTTNAEAKPTKHIPVQQRSSKSEVLLSQTPSGKEVVWNTAGLV